MAMDNYYGPGWDVIAKLARTFVGTLIVSLLLTVLIWQGTEFIAWARSRPIPGNSMTCTGTFLSGL